METGQKGKAIVQSQKAIVQWKEEPITISFSDVKNLICPLATEQEVIIFLKTCQSLQLNPFEREIYLIKYSEKDKAAIVVAIESYLKAAEQNPNFDGFESGIILKDAGGKLEFREGAFILDEERAKLVGGWAKVYRKDRIRPFYVAVNKKECIRYRRDGSLTEFWTEEKQPWMLRKVGLKRSLVEAFPSLFSGTNVDYEVLPAEVREVLPETKGETPEGELPPAYEKGGEPDWKLWWVRQKEKGLSSDEVHNILGITSLKTDWIEKGRTLEEAEDIITAALLAKHRAEEPPRASPKPKVKRDPETIKSIAELYKACHEDFGLQPKEVLKELGVTSQNDIADVPANCYQQIAVVRQ